jgi:nucleotide-binding universal stress UspA family protein
MTLAEVPARDRDPFKSTVRRRVVVGVNGSASSISALRLAVEEALASDATVDVVCAFVPSAPWPGSDAAAPVIPNRYRDTYGPGLVLPAPSTRTTSFVSAAESAAFATAERCVRAAFVRRPDVRLRIVTQAGRPRDVLVELARGADLLVVGACAHPEHPSRVAESTAQSCVRHAQCPVLVVPPEEEVV